MKENAAGAPGLSLPRPLCIEATGLRGAQLALPLPFPHFFRFPSTLCSLAPPGPLPWGSCPTPPVALLAAPALRGFVPGALFLSGMWVIGQTWASGDLDSLSFLFFFFLDL